MALSRRTGTRFQGSIWPGFVDAMTGLLLVLMFVLTIFMVVQYVLTERITGQESELDQLSGEVAALARALGVEERSNAQLEARLGALNATLNDAQEQVNQQAALIASLTSERDSQATALKAAQTRITGFEAQVAALIAARDTALGQVATLEDSQASLQERQAQLLSEQEALNLALASARNEVDAQAEAARLAASRREALDALVADLRARNAEAEGQVADLTQQVAETEAALSEEEAARLAEAAAAEMLRNRLENADAELTAMTLALEQQRREAEKTLTLLAAARAAEADLDSRLSQTLLRLQEAEKSISEGEDAQENAARLRAEIEALRGRLDETSAELTEERDDLRAQLAQALAAKLAAETLAEDTTSEAEKRAALLAAARSALAEEEATSAAAQRQTELLNQQVAALRQQLGDLQALLDDAVARDAAQSVELQSLGSELNTALARVAAEQRRRAELEAAERARLEAQTKDLEQYRSEFFGRLRNLLGAQEGVRIEGDRFVFSSEVLFPPGGAVLSPDGEREIAKVAGILRAIAGDIPSEINWVIRVDGHTDNVPLSGLGEFADNWELSQARALSVVKYMISAQGIPPDRLAANGFGQYQPVATGDSEEARAQNRRIELKFTEK
ncbi:peptidoglycan -binding protein [Sulfitobacter sp. G21635-S1]|uniref:peptidoglycan -binding protein n=1 Tax=Sulfitobacter sp. G21635-S1 TaxID=3014043 RepID=UPI0022AE8846|nr:peptidoglycan -binding protein [Sulfitobacter sp. G21635-S1]MCZ4254477.1 peptidoglycan -binding protein [Sulfitobacter sp. G21635-S1]